MITVSILINGQPLYARTCINRTREHKEKMKKPPKGDIYECDDGTLLIHERDDGAVALAHKMLDTIRETR